MKVGDLVESTYHMIQGIVVEVGDGCADYNNGPAVRVKWFDGDDSTEWAKALSLVSSS